MRRGLTAVVAATLMTAGMASGTAQAAQSSSPASWCGTGWNYSPAWGASAGRPCWNPAHVEGWVDDRATDGKCVMMRFYWYQQGRLVDTQDSQRVCDRDEAVRFTLESSRKHADWVNWELVRV